MPYNKNTHSCHRIQLLSLSLLHCTSRSEHFDAHSVQDVEERTEICTGSARNFKLCVLLHEIQNCFKTKKIIF